MPDSTADVFLEASSTDREACGASGATKASRSRVMEGLSRNTQGPVFASDASCTADKEEDPDDGPDQNSDEDPEDPDAPHPALYYHAEDPAPVQRDPVSTREATARIDRADAVKRKGNEMFKSGDYLGASELYTSALKLAPLDDDLVLDEDSVETLTERDIARLKADMKTRRAVLFANRAACRLHLEDLNGTVEDCSSAIELDETNVKAYVRRAKAFEALGEYERGLEDVERVFKLHETGDEQRAVGGAGGGALPQDAGQTYKGWAEAYVKRVGPLAEQRREEMKAEMIDKLKELGNSFLGNFGLSLDNFKAEQGADGGYSIKFG